MSVPYVKWSIKAKGANHSLSQKILPQVLYLQDGRDAEVGLAFTSPPSCVHIRIGIIAADITCEDAFHLSEALRRMARKIRKAQKARP